MQPDSIHLYLQGMGWVMRGVASMAKVSVVFERAFAVAARNEERGSVWP
jgi:hypothetical protein